MAAEPVYFPQGLNSGDVSAMAMAVQQTQNQNQGEFAAMATAMSPAVGGPWVC